MADERKDRSSISRLLGRAVGEAVNEATGVVDGLVKHLPGGGSTRVITRYANRKLYDTSQGAFTSLANLERLVRDGIDVKVVDKTTGEDMTQDVLAQIADRVARGSDRQSDDVLSFIRAEERTPSATSMDAGTKDEIRELRAQVAALTALVEKLATGNAAPSGDPE